MAENLSNAPHPLANNGTSQQQRSLTAQLPGFVQIDERTESDLLEYVFQLARTVVYHEVEAEQLRKSDWQDFFRLSVPIQLALIAKYDVAGLRMDFQTTLQDFDTGLGRRDVEPLFSSVFELARIVNRWQLNSPESSPLKTEINNLITNDLRFSFRQLVATANEAELKLGASVYRRPQSLQSFVHSDSIWQFSASDLMVVGTPASNSSAQAKGTLDDKKKFYAKKAEELFQVFLQGITRIVKSAQNPEIQKKSIESIANHQAHIGLLLAFTRMFKVLQADLNGLGEKHLDFYLRNVLCLQPKLAVPDNAHLVVELDKQIQKYKLEKGKAFKASAKDKKGQEMHFAQGSEAVLTQAQVVELRTLYRDTGNDSHKGLPANTDDQLQRIRVAPKANSYDGRGLDFEDPNAATWETLGSPKPKKPDSINAPARIGFLIASPTLLLNEGDGSVIITLTFDANLPNPSEMPSEFFRIKYSGKKDWIPANASANANANELLISFAIAPAGEPLTFADPLALKADFGTTDPIVLVELNPDLDPNVLWVPYDDILKRVVTSIKLKVTANTVRNLLLSNDEGVIDPNKPFMPFGAIPHIGSDFVVGSEEVFRKKLTEVTLHATWDKLPTAESFGSYYQWYESAPGAIPFLAKPQNADFKADLHFLQNGTWVKGISEPSSGGFIPDMALPFQLFGTNNAVPPPTKTDFEIDRQLNVPSRVVETLQPYSNTSKSGFVKLSLAGSDFRHAQYPNVLAGRLAEIAQSGFSPTTLGTINSHLTTAQSNLDNTALNLIQAESNLNTVPVIGSTFFVNLANTNISNTQIEVDQAQVDLVIADAAVTTIQNTLAGIQATDLPNPPYTPTIKEFHLSYTAECEWSASSEGDMTFAHVHPYEAQNHEKQTDIAGLGLLPTFKEEGTLYIGLKNLIPGASLNLLFQMAEATANPDALPHSTINKNDQPDWKYLKGNKWEVLRPSFEVRHDSTKGLIASGIVEFTIPFEISSKDTTILPNNLHWLKVSFEKGTAGVSETVAVHAQAIRTTFDLRRGPDHKLLNDTGRLVDPLASGSISKPVLDDAALKKIKQPYESFGGRPEEDNPTFRKRAGEHLRHKGRSIALYDYERMVLEHFPEVFKVKCLTHTHVFKNASGFVRDFYIAPGHVSLAVIPDITRFGFAEKLRPCASRALLQDIETFLKKHVTPFVKIHAVNPVFQDVNVKVTVVLTADKDPVFYKEVLANDILRFLTPWAFGEKDSLAFGGNLYGSSVLHFIETLDYVDYIVAFSLVDPVGQIEGNVVLTHTERSIIAAGKIDVTPLGQCPPSILTDAGLVGLGHEMINTLKITG